MEAERRTIKAWQKIGLSDLECRFSRNTDFAAQHCNSFGDRTRFW